MDEHAKSGNARRHEESAAPRLRRRLLRSLLAGSGLTAATLGGPLSGGATAADPHIVPPAGGSSSSETTASGSATTPSAGGIAGSSSTTTTTTAESAPRSSSAGAPTSSSTTSGSTSSSASSGGSGGGARTRRSAPASGEHRAPETSEVTLPKSSSGSGGGKPTASTTPTAPTSGTANGSTTAATGSGNVAQAPQMVGSHVNALSALSKGVAVSAQAIDLFYQVPPFLLPIYQAAAVQYGVPWEVLAAINEVETNYGNDLSVSTAGAVGWMQFMPATWLEYGVDALDAGYADPYNPVDAIFAAGRYLAAAGAAKNLRGAVFSYNHSQEYVESVMLRARLLASYPPSAIATLTGLTEGVAPLRGAHIQPASIDASAFAGSASAGAAGAAPAPSAAAKAASTSSTGRGRRRKAAGGGTRGLPNAKQFVNVEGADGAAVVASQSGRIVALGHSKALGNYLALEDAYGDVFTYAGMQSIVARFRDRQEHATPAAARIAEQTVRASSPHGAASAGSQPPQTLSAAEASAKSAGESSVQEEESSASGSATGGKVLLYAHPGNPDARAVAARLRSAAAYAGGWQPMQLGAVVSQGTALGSAASVSGGNGGKSGAGSGTASLLRFAIKPAGDENAVNPAPIFQSWRQLQRALHPNGASGGAGLVGATADSVTLMSQSQLERAVLADAAIALPACARGEVAAGRVDGRALATLLFLSRSGLSPTVSELRCAGHLVGSRKLYRTGGAGAGLDIAKINGTPITGHQGSGTITDLTIRTLLTLQGRFAPEKIVSLMRYPGAPSTRAKATHADFIEVDFAPARSTGKALASAAAVHSAASGSAAPAPGQVAGSLGSIGLSGAQWDKLIERIGSLQEPRVPNRRSPSALRDRRAGGR